jgi:DNA recombination protein RmuC
MFLPIESLYAEVLSIPGLFDTIQREYKVNLAGPANFVAVLNSLQMGFKTLAIEKRSSEVWNLLSVVKSEFSKFGDILENTQKKLDLASKSIGDASKKTRTIERRLRDVHELPTNENQMDLLEE